MKILRYLTAGALGALAAYLFDPVSGRGRRTRLRDQSRARAKDLAHEVANRARYESGRMRGLLHEMGAGDEPPIDEAELLQKVRSEAVGPASPSTSDIEVSIEDGETIVVRGNTKDPAEAQELISRIESVTGVRKVRSELSPG